MIAALGIAIPILVLLLAITLAAFLVLLIGGSVWCLINGTHHLISRAKREEP